MKNYSKKILSIMVALLITLMSTIPAFAAESKTASKGSTVEYTLSVADSKQKVVGLHLELFFDEKVMKLTDLKTDVLSTAIINANDNNDGRINMIYSNISGFKCEEKTDLVTLTFEVIKKGNTEVQYYVPYFYDLDLVNITNYTFTETVRIDNKVITEDATPVLADDDTLSMYSGFDKGDFVNNQDGSTQSGTSVQDTTTAPAVDTTSQADATDSTESAPKKTLEYTLSVSDIKSEVTAVEIGFIYNVDAMKLVDVKLLALDGAGVNSDEYGIGQILIIKDFDDTPGVFEEKTDLVTLVFEVIDDKNTEIKYYVKNLLGVDGKAVDTYSFYQNNVLDGQQVSSKDEAAILADADEIQNVESKRPISTNASEGADNNVQNGSDEGKKSNTILIVSCIGGVLLVVAIVTLVLLKTKSGKKSETSSEDSASWND